MTQTDHDLVLVIDFGAQYAQLIARRVREAKVYSEIVPHTASVEPRSWPSSPKAIILSGGPQSVYAPGAPQVDPQLFDAGVPAFGICYGFQAMARALGGDVARTGLSEFGRTEATISTPRHPAGRAARPPAGLDEPRRLGRRRTGRLHRAGQLAPAPRSPRSRTPAAGSPACSGTRRCCTPRPVRPVLETVPLRHRRLPPDWTAANIVDESVAADPGPGRRQARHLRAVRRGRLGGGRGAGAAGGR